MSALAVEPAEMDGVAGEEDVYADPYRVLAKARSYGRLRAVDPENAEQVNVVREAVNYDPKLHPKWQEGGDAGVHEIAAPEDYRRGVRYVRRVTTTTGADGRVRRRTDFERVETGQPHRPWSSRDHFLQVLLPAATKNNPDAWQGKISASALRAFAEYATAIVLDPSTGRCCIVRTGNLAKSVGYSEETARTFWKVLQALGLAVLMRPGRMLNEVERGKAHASGSHQRGLANEYAFVTPAGVPQKVLATPHEPVRAPLRLLRGGMAANPRKFRRGAQIASQGLVGAASGLAVENKAAGRAGRSQPALAPVTTLTPPKRYPGFPSHPESVGALGGNDAAQGTTEPPPAARAMTREADSGAEPRLEQAQTRSQRTQERRGATPSDPDAAPGRQHPAPGRPRSGRVYDQRALAVAADLIERLPWLAAGGVRPGHLETTLRRFAGAAMAWTAADIIAAIAAANRRNGRTELPIHGVKKPISYLAHHLRDLDHDADHPRFDPNLETTATTPAEQLRPEGVSQRVRENRALVERAREARAAGLSPAQVLLPTITDRAATAAAGIRDELAARRAQRESTNNGRS